MGTDKLELMVSIFDKVQKGCMAFQLDLTYFIIEHFFEIWYMLRNMNLGDNEKFSLKSSNLSKRNHWKAIL